MRAVLLKGVSRYDALRVFTDELAGDMREHGIEPVIVDMLGVATDQDIIDRLVAAGKVDLAFTFNVLGHYSAPDGRSLSNIISAPVVVQHVDYPLTHRDRIEQTPSAHSILTVDPSHVEMLEKLYGKHRFANIRFSPHAAIGKPHRPAETAEAFVAERPIPMLFSGTWYAPTEPQWKQFPEFVAKLFDDAAELALSVEFMPALDAIDTVLDGLGGPGCSQDPQFLPVRLLADLLHEWVRATRRMKFFEAAASAGLPLTVYGEGYEAVLDRFPNIDYRGKADYHKNVELMRQSRIVANINANFGRGSHERPFTAMVAGAVAASDFSTYYADQFEPGREIALYRWSHLTEDLAALKALLEDPVRLYEMAEAGHAKSCANHRWINRIDTILAAAGLGAGR
jgi:hypothetical protein